MWVFFRIPFKAWKMGFESEKPSDFMHFFFVKNIKGARGKCCNWRCTISSFYIYFFTASPWTTELAYIINHQGKILKSWNDNGHTLMIYGLFKFKSFTGTFALSYPSIDNLKELTFTVLPRLVRPSRLVRPTE